MKKLFFLLCVLTLSTGCSPDNYNVHDKKSFLVSYLEAWSRSDYDRMYKKLSSATKENLSLGEFQAEHVKSEELTGGIKECKLLGFDIDNGARALASIKIIYQNRSINTLTFKNWIHKESGDWKISDGPLVKPSIID